MLKQNVWLIGGTSESTKIASLLTSHFISVIATVTTNNAKNLYPFHPHLTVIADKILPENIYQFLQQNQIKIIIDASHPYAVNISTAVISIAQQYNYPYLRYERQEIKANQSNIIYLPSLSVLLKNKFINQKRVLLTIGCNSLHFFKDYQNHATLFARILPYPQSLNKAVESGFTNDRLIAIRPPLSYELEKALWQLWHIETVITKAGGKQGGENIKRKLAKDLNIQLIIIQRPEIKYPRQTEKISDVLTFCFQYFN
jgi:precorrin-6A/cobalt-precorrin-6A reductase